jgi:hypothetical protein
MNDDSGLLSIDFIAGFTIFMIVFIIVVTMVSGLLVGLQSRTIDYDALAYRTGVILAEDAGDPGGAGDINDPHAPGWEVKNFASDAEKNQIIRLGLAISKNYPNILSPAKVDKFFYHNTGFTNNDYLDYRKRLMLFNFNNLYLSTLPTFYHFNIRFKSIDNQSDIPSEFVPNITSPLYSTAFIGDSDSGVQNYGYSRRVVKIKQPSSMDVNLSYPSGVPDQKQFSVEYKISDLQNAPLGLRYVIDPVNEQTAINVTLNNSANVALTEIKTVQYFNNTGGNPLELTIPTDSPTVKVYLNTNTINPAMQYPAFNTVYNRSNVLLVVDPGYLENSFSVKNASAVYLRCTFNNTITNRTDPIPYYYLDEFSNPNPNLTMPFLVPAVMEVKVW